MLNSWKQWSVALSAGAAMGAMIAAAPASAAWQPVELGSGEVVDTEQKRQVFSTRNGMAYVALQHALRVADDVDRSVLLFGEEPGLVVVDMGPDHAAVDYDFVGFGGDDAHDVVFAVEDHVAGAEPDAHLTDAAGFVEDIEAETGFALFGVAELLIEEQSASLLVYVDPTSMFDQFLHIFDMALMGAMVSGCDPDGQIGETCEWFGDANDCWCGVLVDPETGEETISVLGDASDPDPFQWLWDAWEKMEEKREERKKKREEKNKSKSKKIADWTEGPMMIVDTTVELQIQGTLDELMPFTGVQ